MAASINFSYANLNVISCSNPKYDLELKPIIKSLYHILAKSV